MINPSYLLRAALFRAVRDAAPQLRGRVLDIGCGSKPYEQLFTRATEYLGLDIDVSGHNHTNSKVDVFYDGSTIPFENASFNSIVSFETFEHIFNLDVILREIHRVLADDGQLMFSIPFCWPEHEQPYDFARYTSFGIAHLLDLSGFEVSSIKKCGHSVSATAQVGIEYFRSVFLPRNRYLRLPISLLTIFPMNLGALFLSTLLPKRYENFFGMVVTARKSVPT